MRLIFLGSGAFGLPTLTHLATAHQVAMVVTQPDRKAGRGTKLTPTPVGQWTTDNLPGIPLLKPERINEPEVRDQVRAIEADAWVVIAFGQKLGPSLLADRFAINLHASRLPRWRGAAPINAAIVAGDADTGNSVITLAEKMDAGFVLGQSRRPIQPTETVGELHDLLAADGPALVESVLQAHAQNRVEFHAQDESLVTLAPKLSRADAWIDLDAGAESCRRRINGLSPWPGVQAELDGQPLKLVRASSEPDADPDATPGTLLDPIRGTFATPSCTLQLLEVQPPGKRPMPWPDFARGRQPERGARLTSSSPNS